MAWDNPDPARLPRALAHRRAIADGVDHLFGRHIDIDERAYQAIEIVRWEGRVAQPQDVWLNTAAVFPGIDDFYHRLGIRRYRPPRRQMFTDAGEDDMDVARWRQMLIPLLFHYRGFAPYAQAEIPTRGANMVLDEGRLTVDAVMIGILESTRLTDSTNPLARDKTNLVVRRLAGSAGVGGDRTKLTGSTFRFIERCVETARALRRSDPDIGRQQFILYVEDEKVRVRPFESTGPFDFRRRRRPLIPARSVLTRSNP